MQSTEDVRTRLQYSKDGQVHETTAWKNNSNDNNYNNDDDDDNNNNNDTDTERNNSRFLFTISSVCHVLSPACWLEWPGHNRVQITSNSLGTYHV